MQDDKKKQQRGKNEAKEQRRRRHGRHPAGPVEKKSEKQSDIVKEPEKPAYVPPGPEFYKSLKRETDEILKITEEANSKYKKKEIQSNWAKYEMPLQSYEEIDEQENMGADYEKLIQAPTSAGSYFQFKHEKSWNTAISPSIYDKYFDIDIDRLALAILTIPFYERNGIEQSLFSENEIKTMNHRATKFKQKYYNDTKYNTPELEAQQKILKSLTDHIDNKTPEITQHHDIEEKSIIEDNIREKFIEVNDKVESTKVPQPIESIPLKAVQEENEKEKEESKLLEENRYTPNVAVKSTLSNKPEIQEKKQEVIPETKQLEEITFRPNVVEIVDSNKIVEDEEIFGPPGSTKKKEMSNKDPKAVFVKVEPEGVEIKSKVTKEVTSSKNPVIESPEDLEKWLDDFLDG